MRFREIWKGIVPGWLRSGDGERLLYVSGLMQDMFAERMRLSHIATHPSTAPADALVMLGRDRRIRRGIDESDNAYADRLVRYLDDHANQGGAWALMDQLYAYLQTDALTLRVVDRRGNWYERASDGTRSYALDLGNWDWDGGGLDRWARFWVIIFSDNGPWDIEWDPTGSGGAVTTTATHEEVTTVQEIIREWKPAGTTCEWIIVCFDDPSTKFGPTTGDDPSGAWGRWSSSGVAVRDPSARYWLGPR